ncbi:hypothetical protein NA56DRAFT_702614 [Hyaloscypha hepaticicola]|uniref:Uncharacterized protein n=1 Tax=Hyaloscypha hepaticicola TaxID=2082293 RepID=A0A2J6Q7N6_9HELO|nr:hypothetical protein NA56DRAFT_702614 [Hyaloscypha hepaticicola]
MAPTMYKLSNENAYINVFFLKAFDTVDEDPKKYDKLALGYNSRSRVRKATIPAIWAVSKSMRMIVRAYFQSQKYHYQRRCCWPESTNEEKYLARSGHRRSSIYQSIKIDVVRSFQLLISTLLLLATSSITVYFDGG